MALNREETQVVIPDNHELSEDDIERLEETMASGTPVQLPDQEPIRLTRREGVYPQFEGTPLGDVPFTATAIGPDPTAPIQQVIEREGREMAAFRAERQRRHIENLQSMMNSTTATTTAPPPTEATLQQFLQLDEVTYISFSGEKLSVPYDRGNVFVGYGHTTHFSQDVVYKVITEGKLEYLEGGIMRFTSGNIYSILGVQDGYQSIKDPSSIRLVCMRDDAVYFVPITIPDTTFHLPKFPRRELRSFVHTVFQEAITRDNESRLKYRKSDLASANRTIVSYTNEIEKMAIRVEELEQQIEMYKQVEKLSLPEMNKRMKEAVKHPLIEDCYLGINGCVIMLTANLSVRYRSKPVDMGQFVFVINPTGEIFIHNLDWKVNGYAHPNISSGNVCWGDAGEQAFNLASIQEYFALADYLIVFLTEQDGGSPYISLSNWLDYRAKLPEGERESLIPEKL